MNTQKVKFILRTWAMDDLDNLVRFANNKKIADNLRDVFPFPYTREDGIAFLTASIPGGVNPPGSVFAIVVHGITCGSVGIFPQTDVHRKNAEIGYWLGEDYWGRGIATGAVKQIIEYGFSIYEINRIFACSYASNLASQRVLEKAGMKLEARLKESIYKNGQFLDELIYSVLR